MQSKCTQFPFQRGYAIRSTQTFLTLWYWAMLGNSCKASVSPFVCLLISVSFSCSGHKSCTLALRQLLEGLLGIWLETAESNGNRGERRNQNKWTSETFGIMEKTQEKWVLKPNAENPQDRWGLKWDRGGDVTFWEEGSQTKMFHCPVLIFFTLPIELFCGLVWAFYICLKSAARTQFHSDAWL